MALQDICRKCKDDYKGCFDVCPVGKMITDLANARRIEELKKRKENLAKKKECDIKDYEALRGYRLGKHKKW